MTEGESNSRWEPHDSSPFSESQPEPVQQPPPPAPDGGYGWVVTACVAIVNGHSWGINAAYSVFLAHYLANETFSGATNLEYAFVGSLSIGCTLLISPLATISVREFGTRPTMLFGALLQSVSLIGASLSTKMWHLFLSQGALFGIGMGLLFLPSYGIIAQCIITFVINAACTLLIRTRYEATGSRQLAFDSSLLKRVEYLLILAFGSFSMLGYFVLIFTLANYANEIGLDAPQAAVIPALLMLGQALGRPVIGYFSDTIGPINMATSMTLLIGVFALTIWVNAKTYGVLVFFALIEGTVAGAFWVTVAPAMVEVIGLENLPSGLTLLWLALVLPSTFSEPIALEIVVRTGNYIGAQLFTGLVFIAAAICMGLLRGWKIGQAKGNAEASADSTQRVRYEKQHGYPRAFIYDCFKWQNV
ncbi:major facilitator superfamily domain-containing protein [Ilyonectria destructans]|nr:major facilitator superfamily domain-containing protein [Ilyonectria destructans]